MVRPSVGTVFTVTECAVVCCSTKMSLPFGVLPTSRPYAVALPALHWKLTVAEVKVELGTGSSITAGPVADGVGVGVEVGVGVALPPGVGVGVGVGVTPPAQFANLK